MVLIEAVGYGESEGWRGEATDAAEELGSVRSGTGFSTEIFSAAGTESAGLGMEPVPAGGADRRGGKFSQRSAAQAARGWKEYRGYGVEGVSGGTSEHANHCAPSRCSGWRMFHQRRMLHAAEDSPRAASRTGATGSRMARSIRARARDCNGEDASLMLFHELAG